jgi:multicomponent Na+:H+ antiporter subunit D
MGGLFKKMPVTGSTNLIASMSISGIPPFSGFWSKFIIIIAAVQSGHYVYALLAVIVSVVTLAYFMKVMKYAYYGGLREKQSGVLEAPLFMRVSMIFLAIICVIGGVIAFPVFDNVFLGPASDVLVKGLNYAVTVSGGIK